tara:strand:+ start:203 stop:463 length:261 start_codon:yes stop_codon:yes gene_type:complete
MKVIIITFYLLFVVQVNCQTLTQSDQISTGVFFPKQYLGTIDGFKYIYANNQIVKISTTDNTVTSKNFFCESFWQKDDKMYWTVDK